MEPLLEENNLVQAGTSHISPLLRSNTMRRTSTSNLGAGSQSQLRRSKSRQFSRSSTDTLPLDRSTLQSINEQSPRKDQAEEVSFWHVFSLLFVALPAFAGLFFDNGGAIMTDVLLLALGCLFLYWSVKWPWEWYHSAQGRVFVDFDPAYLEDEDIAMFETPIDTDTEGLDVVSDTGSATPVTRTTGRESASKTLQQKQQLEAGTSLKQHEILALLSCFLMPLGVAYLLHAIRPYLSRPSGGLVSNSNLTLFALGAEVRPFLHVFKLLNRRTLYLQKIVAAPPDEEDLSYSNLSDLTNLRHRLDALESKLPETAALSLPKGKIHDEENRHDVAETEAMITSATSSLQPQLDALNRAVRRYEKRATMQSLILDSRLRDLDNRVNDTLSLAAAASRMASRPGLITWITETVSGAISKAINSVLALVLLPWRISQQAYVVLMGGKQKKTRKKKMDGEKVKKVI